MRTTFAVGRYTATTGWVSSPTGSPQSRIAHLHQSLPDGTEGVFIVVPHGQAQRVLDALEDLPDLEPGPEPIPGYGPIGE
jgi:hypothetical protein